MKLDYLAGTDFKIEQGNDFYHMNSDTELLGRFIHLKHRHRFLEIGCNTGAILLYASIRHPEKMVGIDLFPEVLALTKINLERYNVTAELHACKVQLYRDEPFDVIACNPPYFSTQTPKLMNENQYKRAGRHEEYLPMEELFSAVKRLLKSNGSFYLVHRASRLNEIISQARNIGLIPVRMQLAYENFQGTAKSVLLEFRFSQAHELQIEAPINLQDRHTFPTL